jgi:hypothetical protein
MVGRGFVSLISLVVALTILPPPAFSQDWSQPWADPEDRPPRVDVAVSGGFLMPTRWSDVALLGSFSPAQGVLEQVLTRDVRVKADTELMAAATYWRNRYGFRTHAGFSRSSLQIGTAPVLTGSAATLVGNINGDITSIGIDTWLYDVGGAIGFFDYSPSRWVWPYGFVGLGGITYKLKQTVAPPLTFIERGPSGSGAGAGTTIIVSDGRQFLLTTNALDTETVFAVNVGLGTDFRIPMRKGAVALRLEIADHVAPSPLSFRVEALSPFGALSSDTGSRYRLVHHLTASAGLLVQIGR